jgi:transposase
MRTGITFEVSAAHRTQLEAIAADRNSPQKHIWRACIILLTAAGCGTAEIMRRTGKAKTCVWRWQERYMQEGVDGLLRDKTRPSRKPPLPKETVMRVVELTLGPPPGEVTHWTATALAKAAGVSASSVQRIWRSHGLSLTGSGSSNCRKTPNSLRSFRISLGSIWRRLHMRWFFPLMKRAKFRLLTALNPACR